MPNKTQKVVITAPRIPLHMRANQKRQRKSPSPENTKVLRTSSAENFRQSSTFCLPSATTNSYNSTRRSKYSTRTHRLLPPQQTSNCSTGRSSFSGLNAEYRSEEHTSKLP